MLHFLYTSKELLTVRITNDFKDPDAERIALLLEGTYDSLFEKEVIFQVESKLPNTQMKLLGDFCQRLPYESHIDLRYPILEWQQA